MIVNVGFFSEELGKTLASTTYKFGTSWERQNEFTTDVFGSLPILHPPIS
jgi:hypothetical protein